MNPRLRRWLTAGLLTLALAGIALMAWRTRRGDGEHIPWADVRDGVPSEDGFAGPANAPDEETVA